MESRPKVKSDISELESVDERTWRSDPNLWECLVDLWTGVAGGVAQIVGPFGLIPLEYYVLNALLRRGEWTTSELTEAFPVTKSRISRVVSKLVNQGLITRRRLRNDRRVVMLSLTREGEALAMDVKARINAFDSTLTADVSEEEMAILASAASRIAANCSRAIGEQANEAYGVNLE